MRGRQGPATLPPPARPGPGYPLPNGRRCHAPPQPGARPQRARRALHGNRPGGQENSPRTGASGARGPVVILPALTTGRARRTPDSPLPRRTAPQTPREHNGPRPPPRPRSADRARNHPWHSPPTPLAPTAGPFFGPAPTSPQAAAPWRAAPLPSRCRPGPFHSPWRPDRHPLHPLPAESGRRPGSALPHAGFVRDSEQHSYLGMSSREHALGLSTCLRVRVLAHLPWSRYGELDLRAMRWRFGRVRSRGEVSSRARLSRPALMGLSQRSYPWRKSVAEETLGPPYPSLLPLRTRPVRGPVTARTHTSVQPISMMRRKRLAFVCPGARGAQAQGPVPARDDRAEEPADTSTDDGLSAPTGHISPETTGRSCESAATSPRSQGRRSRPPCCGPRCVPPHRSAGRHHRHVRERREQ